MGDGPLFPSPPVRLAAAFVLVTAGLAWPTPSSGQSTASSQHVVVVVEEARDVRGRLVRMERGPDGWRRVGGAVPVVVGRGGVGPKREGDGRSPRGIFPLEEAFGYAAEPPAGISLPYRTLRRGTVCVDDPRSGVYDQIVDSTAVADVDWTSAEAMRRDLVHGDDLYRMGVNVDHNPERVPGAGSCIFLHVWRDSASPTEGCTAMPAGDLLAVLRWLDPGARPLLVQGTRSDLLAMRRAERIPYPVPPP